MNRAKYGHDIKGSVIRLSLLRSPKWPDPTADRIIRGKPALAIWGEADRTLQAEHFLPLFSSLFPAAPIKTLSGVGHYCLEDAPETIAGLITEFLRQT